MSLQNKLKKKFFSNNIWLINNTVGITLFKVAVKFSLNLYYWYIKVAKSKRQNRYDWEEINNSNLNINKNISVFHLNAYLYC